MPKDHYSVLGVSKTATADEIKKAYRANVRKFHPDSATADKKAEYEAILTDVNRAYSVLSDPEKRRGYDQYGDEAEQMEAQGGGMSREDVMAQFANMGMFGGFGRSNKKNTGPEPVQSQIKITLDKVYSGATIKHTIRRSNFCKKCAGTGDKTKKSPNCSACGGQGQTMIQQGNSIGIMDCRACGGKGKSPVKKENKCIDCNGIGNTMSDHELSVFIKKGIDNLEIITIKNQGNEKSTGARSNVYIRVEIIPHSMFKRNVITGSGRNQKINHLNLSITLNITLTEALCGFKKSITHLDGHSVDIISKKTIYQGSIFTVPNEGLIEGNNKGSLYVLFNIIYTDLSEDHKNKIFNILTKSVRPALTGNGISNEVPKDQVNLVTDAEMFEITQRSARHSVQDDDDGDGNIGGGHPQCQHQ